MEGRRLSDGDQLPSAVQPGDYWKDSHGWWYAETPKGVRSRLGTHTVTMHEDGTITVSPSILAEADGQCSWHGYLERGVWRPC